MKRLRQQFILLVLATVTFSSLATIMPVAAVDPTVDMSLCRIVDQRDNTQCADDFYASQPIMWYDPCAPDVIPPTATTGTVGTTPTTTGPLVGNSNAEKMWIYLGNKGLTAEQIAGILGNFKQESGFDPAIIQGGAIAPPTYTPVNGVGFGIAQWTFTSRQAPLVALAQSSGRSVIDLSLQLDYLWQELNGTHAHALATLKGANTPEDAAYVFHRDFEGSADSPTTVALVRGGNARMLYELYKNTSSTADAGDAENFVTDPSNPLGYPTTNAPPPQATAAPLSSCTSGEPAATGATAGIYSDFRKDTFTLYNQCSKPLHGGSWGTKQSSAGKTVCQAGAIPVALAMIAKNVTGQTVTPDDTVDYFANHKLWYSAGGSLLDSPLSAAEAFKMRAEMVANKASIADYKTVFDKGGLVMAISTGTAPFTSNRHAIVLRGITDDGNSFVIADPRNSDANVSPKNQIAVNKILTDIRSDTRSVSYAFYKD